MIKNKLHDLLVLVKFNNEYTRLINKIPRLEEGLSSVVISGFMNNIWPVLPTPSTASLSSYITTTQRIIGEGQLGRFVYILYGKLANYENHGVALIISYDPSYNFWIGIIDGKINIAIRLYTKAIE